MNTTLSFRLFSAVVISAIFIRRYTACNPPDDDANAKRWHPLIDPMMLTNTLAAVFLLSVIFLPLRSDRSDLRRCVGMLAETMTATAIYFALLLPVLPLLRRRFSARSCAMLWLLPNMLYLVAYGLKGDRPLLLLPVRTDLNWLVWIWLAGALTVLIWKNAQHLRFRRTLLDGAHEPDAETRTLFQSVREEIEEAAMLQKPLPLLLSPHTATPLSVGLSRKSLRVVLPERDYTPEELRLIFRHELIHIVRQDAGTKLFLTFCAAAMWWNPLQWLAMRRCADDLELGCDEYVLLGEPEDARARYAALLLTTAGDERGFTTCLSATAEALRYRLENVLRPREKQFGALLLGTVSAALIFLSGSVAFGCDPQPLETAVGADAVPQRMEDLFLSSEYWDLPEPDAAALWDALRTREVYRLVGNYYPRGDVTLYGGGAPAGGEVRFDCTGRYVLVTVYDAKGYSKDHFCLAFAQEPDWNALLTQAE